MKTTDEYRKRLLAQLIEQSAKIDILLIESLQDGTNFIPEHRKELEELRVNQLITTNKLHDLEDFNINVWENIGDGG